MSNNKIFNEWAERISEKALILGGALSVLCALISIFCAILLLPYTGNFQGLSDKIIDWVSFSNVLTPIAQIIIGVTTLIAALWLGIRINLQIERQRQKSERDREVVRLSEKMFDTDFYAKVTVPAWEVAVKWCNPDTFPPDYDGRKYKAEVALGELVRPMNRYTWGSLADGNSGRSIRMHPHYFPYDVPYGAADGEKNTAVRNELSEHMAFAVWLRFWFHVAFLERENLLGSKQVREIFKDWYEWWFPFMEEFTGTCIALKRLINKHCPEGSSGLNGGYFNNMMDHNFIHLQNFHRYVLKFEETNELMERISSNIREIVPLFCDMGLENFHFTEDEIQECVDQDLSGFVSPPETEQ